VSNRRASDDDIVTVLRYLESADTGKIFKDPDTKQWYVVGIMLDENGRGRVFTVGSFDEAFTTAADLIRDTRHTS
jgi:hypothetical protein